MISVLSGCSRTFWRHQADRDSYELISEKMFDPAWQNPRMDITPDPRSRFYDPFNPDCEPLPPDDPAAHQFLHEAGGWKGSKSWHKLGEAFSVENPDWLANLMTPETVPEEGEVILQTSATGIIQQEAALRDLDLGELIELAYIHDREYQSALEDVYLQALNVSQERFEFGVRYLPQPSINLTRLWNPEQASTLNANSTVFGLSQVLPAGTQWAIELTNNTLWVFSGGNTSRSASNISWSIVQPLLREAGRKVGLESLTLNERRLLYAVRDLARFRKIFFGDVTGNNGYLGLLQQHQVIANQADNIKRLQRQVEVLTVLRSKGREDTQGIFDLQIAQLATELADAINSLRQSEAQIQDSYDSFKISLGLPPDLSFTIDTGPLKEFELIAPETLEMEVRVFNFQNDYWGILGLPTQQEIKAAKEQNIPVEEIRPIQPDAVYRERARLLRDLFEDVREVVLGGVERDFERVEQIAPERLSRLSEENQLLFQRNLARDTQLLEKSKEDLEVIENYIEQIETTLKKPQLTNADKQQIYDAGSKAYRDLYRTVQNLEVTQVNERVETVLLEPFDMSLEEVTQLALENRLDLQNSRAILGDARRQVEIAANRLQAVLNLRVQGDIGTAANGDNPLDFRRDQSGYQVGLEFTTPLDQQAARNAYRDAQIAYQRARRAYMLAEDRVKQDVRQEWRQLQVLTQNFETSRQSVRLAAIQLDSNVESANDPGAAGGNSQGGLNLLNALRSVLNAQNSFIRNWVQYEQNRINIYRDMGIMQIDDRGVWIDNYYQTVTSPMEEIPKILPDLPQINLLPGSEVQFETEAGISALPDRIDSKVMPALGLEREDSDHRVLPPLPDATVPGTTETNTHTQPRNGLLGGSSSPQNVSPLHQVVYEEFRNGHRPPPPERNPVILEEWQPLDGR